MSTQIEDLCNDVRSGNLSVELAALILKGIESFEKNNASTRSNTTPITKVEDRKTGLFIRELSKRLNLPVEFIVEHLDTIGTIFETFKSKELYYG